MTHGLICVSARIMLLKVRFKSGLSCQLVLLRHQSPELFKSVLLGIQLAIHSTFCSKKDGIFGISQPFAHNCWHSTKSVLAFVGAFSLSSSKLRDNSQKRGKLIQLPTDITFPILNHPDGLRNLLQGPAYDKNRLCRMSTVISSLVETAALPLRQSGGHR
ncbi:hypothetical protein BDR07DRAFT_428230 [Suillus spraguei]|nr:hypothetical protein BDR07DRAFT_428230 [Suillus spraguei]